jgi:DNA-directed RNA polymerase specialized sigma24 family protein
VTRDGQALALSRRSAQAPQRPAGVSDVAFERFVRREAPALWGLALALAGGEAAATSALATGLERAFATDPLGATCRVEVARAALRARREPSKPIEVGRLLERLPEHVAPWRREHSPLTRAVGLRLIERLPRPERSALLLVDGAGVDVAEAAEVVQRSKDALRADLHRGRRALRELLDPWLRRDPAGRCRASG